LLPSRLTEPNIRLLFYLISCYITEGTIEALREDPYYDCNLLEYIPLYEVFDPDSFKGELLAVEF
jgi:hypothetical protein